MHSSANAGGNGPTRKEMEGIDAGFVSGSKPTIWCQIGKWSTMQIITNTNLSTCESRTSINVMNLLPTCELPTPFPPARPSQNRHSPNPFIFVPPHRYSPRTHILPHITLPSPDSSSEHVSEPKTAFVKPQIPKSSCTSPNPYPLFFPAFRPPTLAIKPPIPPLSLSRSRTFGKFP